MAGGIGPARRLLGAALVVHPFPSLLNAGLVWGLALVAGGSMAAAAGLALAMLGLQFSIGALNDYCDVELDAVAKPAKPIPAGYVSRDTALAVAAAAGGGALIVAAAFGVPELLLAAAMLTCGLAYDVALKRGPLGWLCLAVALPLLPVFAWYGAVSTLPPRPELLLPLAALAGPALQLANGLVDLERDDRVGVRGLAGRLGQRRALALMALLLGAIHAIAALTLLAGHSPTTAVWMVVAAAAGLAMGGLWLSSDLGPARREWGWRAQAASLALLAVAWIGAAHGSGAAAG